MKKIYSNNYISSFMDTNIYSDTTTDWLSLRWKKIDGENGNVEVILDIPDVTIVWDKANIIVKTDKQNYYSLEKKIKLKNNNDSIIDEWWELKNNEENLNKTNSEPKFRKANMNKKKLELSSSIDYLKNILDFDNNIIITKDGCIKTKDGQDINVKIVIIDKKNIEKEYDTVLEKVYVIKYSWIKYILLWIKEDIFLLDTLKVIGNKFIVWKEETASNIAKITNMTDRYIYRKLKRRWDNFIFIEDFSRLVLIKQYKPTYNERWYRNDVIWTGYYTVFSKETWDYLYTESYNRIEILMNNNYDLLIQTKYWQVVKWDKILDNNEVISKTVFEYDIKFLPKYKKYYMFYKETYKDDVYNKIYKKINNWIVLFNKNKTKFALLSSEGIKEYDSIRESYHNKFIVKIWSKFYKLNESRYTDFLWRRTENNYYEPIDNKNKFIIKSKNDFYLIYSDKKELVSSNIVYDGAKYNYILYSEGWNNIELFFFFEEKFYWKKDIYEQTDVNQIFLFWFINRLIKRKQATNIVNNEDRYEYVKYISLSFQDKSYINLVKNKTLDFVKKYLWEYYGKYNDLWITNSIKIEVKENSERNKKEYQPYYILAESILKFWNKEFSFSLMSIKHILSFLYNISSVWNKDIKIINKKGNIACNIMDKVKMNITPYIEEMKDMNNQEVKEYLEQLYDRILLIYKQLKLSTSIKFINIKQDSDGAIQLTYNIDEIVNSWLEINKLFINRYVRKVLMNNVLLSKINIWVIYKNKEILIKEPKSLNDVIHILKLFTKLHKSSIQIPEIKEYVMVNVYKTKENKWDDEPNLFLDKNILLKYDFNYSNFEKIEDKNHLIINELSDIYGVAQQIEKILNKEDSILFAFLKKHLSDIYIFIYNKDSSINLYSIYSEDKLQDDINSFDKLKKFLKKENIEDITKSKDIVQKTKDFINNNSIAEIEISASQDYHNNYNMLCWVTIDFLNSNNTIGLYVILASQWSSKYFFINSDDFNLKKYIEDEEEKTINAIYKVNYDTLLFKTKDWTIDEVSIRWIEDEITNNNEDENYYY